MADPARTMMREMLAQAATRNHASADTYTSITLSSGDGKEHRAIRLEPGLSTMMGRASKSDKEKFANPSNAYFDSAVMSRTHASLKVNPWHTPANQITLTDLGSMHGTTVNGQRLIPHKPFHLKAGDEIKLGDTINHRASSVDGVTLTFGFSPLKTTPKPEKPEASHKTGRSFQAYGSSESEFDSEDDESVMDHASSPKTSPEQPKPSARLGSQEMPIVLDDKITRPIDLSHSDAEDFVPSKRANFTRSPMPSVIQDSMARDVPELAPESVRRFPSFNAAVAPVAPMAPAAKPSSITYSQLAKIYQHTVPETHDRSHDDSEVDEVDDFDDVDVYEDEPMSISNMSDGEDVESNYSDYDNPPVEYAEERTSSLARDEASPELGSLAPVASTPQTKPRYDPVRGSYPPNNSTAFEPMRTSQTSGWDATRAVPYSTWNAPSSFYNPHSQQANFFDSVPRATIYDFPQQSRLAGAQDDEHEKFMRGTGHPTYVLRAPENEPAHHAAGVPTYDGYPLNGWSSSQTYFQTPAYDAPPRERAAKPFAEQQTFSSWHTAYDRLASDMEASKQKASIKNLVEDPLQLDDEVEKAERELDEQNHNVFGNALAMDKLKKDDDIVADIQAITNKRKAVEMDDDDEPAGSFVYKMPKLAQEMDDDDEVTKPITCKVTKLAEVVPATTTAAVAAPPTTQRVIRQPSSFRRKALRTTFNVAKVAGGSLLGAAGTVAFLNSPYADQLITWLG